MVNFKDPVIVKADFLDFIKFLHLVDGMYIWEYFMSLDYEWSVITGKRPYRWTIWIYSITRLSTLMGVVMNLIGFNVTSEINCQAWIVFVLVFAYLAFAAASSLIVLRVAAIWNRNYFALALAGAAWLTNVGFLIHDAATSHAVWVPSEATCSVVNSAHSRNNIIVTFATDFVLCAIVLVGLLRTRRTGKSGIWSLLYKQGLVWIFLATVAEVPPAVFTAIDLNDAWNLMFQTPSLIVMSIGATRIYRTLTDFNAAGFGGESSSRNASTGMPSMRFMRQTNPQGEPTVIPMSRLEVSVHTAYENYSNGDQAKPARLSDEDLEMGGKTVGQ